NCLAPLPRDDLTAEASRRDSWRLAGGANHRFIVKIESEPQPGRRKSLDVISSPSRGSRYFVGGTGGLHHRLISAPPPASVIHAVPSGRCRTRNLATASCASFLPESVHCI